MIIVNRDLEADKAFDITKITALLDFAERDRRAVESGTTGSSDTVHVRLFDVR